MPEERPTWPAEAAWQAVKTELKRSLPDATFELWIKPIRAAGAQAETLYVTGPERVRTWVDRRYMSVLTEALGRVDAGFERILLVEPASKAKGGAQTSKIAEPVPVDPRHTFSRFVIGPGNRFAHAAALAVAEAPGEAYNPLFLHGPSGLGKTHLMGAIAGYLREQHPELTVHYTTAERFTSEFVTALRTQGAERFKQRYRALDALLIDDVNFLEDKKKTEEEFVHTFNTLFAAGKQIVMSSDRPPSALAALEERLRDRFEWGLTVELEHPDMRTRVALLWRFASDAVDQVPEPDILRDIANRSTGNIRKLEGAMTRVAAISSVYSEPLGKDSIERAFSSQPRDTSENPEAIIAPSISAIQEAVSSVLGVPRADLLSAKRTPTVARARHLAMFLARELTPLTFVQIAREFNRDHSTVMSAIRSVANQNEPGSTTAGAIHRVRVMLGESPPHTDPSSGEPHTP